MTTADTLANGIGNYALTLAMYIAIVAAAMALGWLWDLLKEWRSRKRNRR